MNTLNYQQARSKILDAYFKDEIQPYHANFCFCGTLAPNEFVEHHGEKYKNWNVRETEVRSAAHQYSAKEYALMEKALLEALGCTYKSPFYFGQTDSLRSYHEGFEDALFEGMEAALIVLKQIHESRGENTDEPTPVFTKRKLVGA